MIVSLKTRSIKPSTFIITMAISVVLLFSFGCSSGRDIYTALNQKKTNHEFPEAWKLLDSLRQINPGFRSGDTTIGTLLHQLDSCTYDKLREKVMSARTLSDVEAIYSVVQVVKKYHPKSKYLPQVCQNDIEKIIIEIINRYSPSFTLRDSLSNENYDPYYDTSNLFSQLAEDSVRVKYLSKLRRLLKNEDTVATDSFLSEFRTTSSKKVEAEIKRGPLVTHQTPALTDAQLAGNWKQHRREPNGNSYSSNRSFYSDGTFKGDLTTKFAALPNAIRVSLEGEWKLENNVIFLSDVYADGKYSDLLSEAVRCVAVFHGKRWIIIEYGSTRFLPPYSDCEGRIHRLRTDDDAVLEKIEKGKYWVK